MTTIDRKIISLSQELSALKQKFVLPFRESVDSDFYNLNKSALQASRKQTFNKLYGKKSKKIFLEFF